MILDNLIGKNLEAITPDAAVIKRLLDAAVRNIADAQIDGLSNENQFDMAYKAIMQLANVAMQANGYRTLTSKPGHHQIMIQSLPKTVGLDVDQMIILDGLRKQRNVADYSGDLVPESTSSLTIV
tara:strand:+ start:15694 stop:16068 length:375 start_codon:yes stop_codon:yes gene_type:complete